MTKPGKQLLYLRPALKRVGLIYAMICGVAASGTVAGVVVAPTVVFMSDKSPTGELTLQNPANTPTQVTIFFGFGLPVSDSLGNVRVELQDSSYVDSRSARDWLKAFPRRLVIPAHGSQVVRFRARPPKDLPTGEYWARVVVRSEEGQTALPVAGDPASITAKLNMIMQTAIMLKYRKGEVTAELQVNDMWATVGDQRVELMVDMTSKGSASYTGLLNCQVRDATHKEIYNRSVHLAVYGDLTRRVDLPLPEGDFEKPYEVAVSISTKGRNDIADEYIIQGNEITRTLVVP